MKKLVVLFSFLFILASCNSPAPLEYYKRSVLSTVYLQHFGITEILGILGNPPLKWSDGNKKFDTVTYQQVIQEKMAYEETLLKDVQSLKVTTDAKNMIATSIDIFQTVLKYEKEFYLPLAALKDNKGNPTVIQAKAFRDLEAPEKEVQGKIDLLWGYGKMYADANGVDLTLEKKK